MNAPRCCEDCQNPSANWSFERMVILPLKLWRTIGSATTLLCDKCIESRLGRELTLADFPDRKVPVYENQKKLNPQKIPVNAWYFVTRGWIL